MSDKMNNKKISSFEIKKHNKFSWSYVYTIDGRKYDIHGGSTYDLRKKVLARDLPWDDENYPEDKLTKTQYDSMKAMKATIENSYTPYNEATKIMKTAKLDTGGTLVPKNGTGIGINLIEYILNEKHT